MSPKPPAAPSYRPRHLDFPPDSGIDRVALGIDFVRRALAEWQAGEESRGRDEDRTVDLVLVTAELLGNAERHGGGTRSVQVELCDGRLRLTVYDNNPLPPRRVLPHRAERTGGHGLHIVERLSLAWGWRPDGPGKAVWAELPA
jgi:anti-sigma regulatory factor (Ser/Thr protein kinase)